MISLTRLLYAEGLRTFVVSLHSSVMLPGATAFAPDEAGVLNILRRLNGFLEFFFGQFGGQAWSVEAELACWPGARVAPIQLSYSSHVT